MEDIEQYGSIDRTFHKDLDLSVVPQDIKPVLEEISTFDDHIALCKNKEGLVSTVCLYRNKSQIIGQPSDVSKLQSQQAIVSDDSNDDDQNNPEVSLDLDNL